MLISLILTATSILTGEIGQSFEIVSKMQCRIDEATIDMNGATSTSTLRHGKKTLDLFFLKKGPAGSDAAAGVLAIEHLGKETILEELQYQSSYIPVLSDVPQAPVELQLGDAIHIALESRYGIKNKVWNFMQR